jgi:hypothetical protein
MASLDRRRRVGQTCLKGRSRAHDEKRSDKVFGRKLDADRYLVRVESSRPNGAQVDPALSRLATADWATRWLDSQAHPKTSTLERFREIVAEPG